MSGALCQIGLCGVKSAIYDAQQWAAPSLQRAQQWVAPPAEQVAEIRQHELRQGLAPTILPTPPPPAPDAAAANAGPRPSDPPSQGTSDSDGDGIPDRHDFCP